MSNVLGFATARKTSRGELLATWLAAGKVKIYDGTRPTNADTAIGSQVLLVEFTLPNPAGTVTSGVFTAGAISAATVGTAGTATWARILDSSAATIFDADVGVTSSGSVIEIDNVSLASGANCTVTSFVLTER